MSTSCQSKPLRILLAEDNTLDCVLLEESFLVAGLDVQIDVIPDGEQFMDLLLRDPRTLATYGLIVLDAHLPRCSTEEMLVGLRDLGAEWTPPVIVFSSMIAETERVRLLSYGARQVLTKPLDLDEYVALAKHFHAVLCGEPSSAMRQASGS